MTINELYNKRASAWEEAKKFLDTHTQENGTMSAEDAQTYERMENDIKNLTAQIDRAPAAAGGHGEFHEAAHRHSHHPPPRRWRW